jgi:NAD(P)-dependent dehydrogenase (short-subunit alcohol dehydrogenase family)
MTTMLDHAGRRVLVTGAAGGAGSAIAKAFARAGAAVVITDLNAEGLAPVASEIEMAGGAVEVQPGDLATREGCRALAARCGVIDILINTAALTFMKYQPVTVRDDDFWDRTFAIDFIAPITLMQELAPGMAARGWGSIINISSVSAVRGTPNLAPYAAAKAALETMSKVAAMEFAMSGSGVRVNCIAFGLVDTPALVRNFPDRDSMTSEIRKSVPLGRVIRPAEVADLCLYLASDASSAVLGTVVTIDGGMVSGAFNQAESFISSAETA